MSAPSIEDLRRMYHRPERADVDLIGVHTHKLGDIGPVAIWLVDGTRIRNDIDTDFVCGGNEARYGYNPPNEIWIDEVLAEGDVAPTLLHEFWELCWMLKGDSYDDAHEKATAMERQLRATWPAWKGRDPIKVVKGVLDRVLKKAG